ncbi:Pyridine nucleotide-disulfide oxidoreductase, partial [Rhizoctonia solani]
MSSLKNIVVVGSGGGAPLVQTLQKQINPDTHRIVVIETGLLCSLACPYCELIISPLLLSPEITCTTKKRAAVSMGTIRSDVKQITDTDVIIESGEAIPYEHLVLAMGSNWTGPLNLPSSKEKAIEHFKSFKSELSTADSILIVGGGSVGIELMNDTYVTKFRQSVLDAMISTGVEVILEDRIPPQATLIDGFMTSENGRRIPADLVILAAGGPSIVRAFDPSAVTESGTVLVTPELQVNLSSGARNVWAIGDIIEWPEQKMVLKASSGHAPVLAKNIIASIWGSKPSPYGGKTEMIFVTIGPNGGRGLVPLFGGVVVGDWIISTMKSSGLFADRTRTALGC